MSDAIRHAYGIEDRPPGDRRIRTGWLIAVTLVAPIAWSVELLANYGLASYVCFPHEQPRTAPLSGWGWVPPFLSALNLATLAVAILAAAAALLLLRRGREDLAREPAHAVRAGEGRNRYFAVWALWGSLWFAAAIAFDTVAVFWVPLCGH